jgi:WxcM-like, C-terminal
MERPAVPHVEDCRSVELRTVFDHRGSISFVESGVDFSFPIKRAYWTYDVPSRASRAGHAHRGLRQLYVAISGSFQVHLDDGVHQRVVALSHPNEGLLMVPGIWRELHGFSSNACLLVLASELFDEADYIREHTDFMRWVQAGRPGP